MSASPESLKFLPLMWRSELIFMPPEASMDRVSSGWRILSPNNPSYWWGNALIMDAPPDQEDLQRWPERFCELVQALQPGSRHMAFDWRGNDPGAASLFVEKGFTFFQLIAMGASHLHTGAPDVSGAKMRGFEKDSDWDQLVEFMVNERPDAHTEAGYRPFVAALITNYRRLWMADQGNWYGAFADEELVGALGLFVEAKRTGSLPRLARFQQVLTARGWRRRGICAALMDAAAQDIAIRFAPDLYLILADANDVARRVYERAGFAVFDHSFGLELPPAAASPATA